MRTAAEPNAHVHELRELPQRLSEVLLAVLRGYVESGQPVGSRDALEQSGLAVSSATIRGAMGELMDLGLLEQPHTSAGRVPTDAAFRLWVDQLLHDPRAGRDVPSELARELDEPVSAPEIQPAPRRGRAHARSPVSSASVSRSTASACASRSSASCASRASA